MSLGADFTGSEFSGIFNQTVDGEQGAQYTDFGSEGSECPCCDGSGPPAPCGCPKCPCDHCELFTGTSYCIETDISLVSFDTLDVYLNTTLRRSAVVNKLDNCYNTLYVPGDTYTVIPLDPPYGHLDFRIFNFPVFASSCYTPTVCDLRLYPFAYDGSPIQFQLAFIGIGITFAYIYTGTAVPSFGFYREGCTAPYDTDVPLPSFTCSPFYLETDIFSATLEVAFGGPQYLPDDQVIFSWRHRIYEGPCP